MAEVYFAGDGHLGHRNICNFRKQFTSIADHDKAILAAFDHVTKRDKTFFTGDWVFEKYALDIIAEVKGEKHLVLGNHDRIELLPDMMKVFRHISGDYKYKEFWVTHIPIHSDEMRGRYNIYAHTHNSTIKDWRYFCTSMEQIDYRAVSLQEIRKEFAERKGVQGKMFEDEKIRLNIQLDSQARANSLFQRTVEQANFKGFLEF